MKILQLISSSGFFGSENVMIQLSRELRSRGFEPVVGVFDNRRQSHLEAAEVARGNRFRVEVFACRGKVDPRTLLRIRRFLRGEHVEILHTHGYKSNLYGLWASVGMEIGRVATCHNWLGEDLKMRMYARLDKMFLRRFDRVIAVSDSIREQLSKVRMAPGKMVMIHNGIDLKRFECSAEARKVREELGIPEGCKVIGSVGRLSAEKGHCYLIQAAQELLSHDRNLFVLIIGDGPLRGALEKGVAEKRGLGSNILFTGTRRDIERIYSAMDVFVLPSLTEGLPMALLEAAAAGKAVVATRVGGIPTIIEHGRSGLLVKPGDAKGLAKAIQEILADPDMGRRMARNAYEAVKGSFSAEMMADRYVEVYEEVASRDRPTRSGSAADRTPVGGRHG
jgi:glycosyltransferase involved in cell wall biosynthesis